uniref:Uncharacterized protein n=1 Tax=Acrobeloides nanus TaxID=290746 RepID=A0A914BVG8_9BILA
MSDQTRNWFLLHKDASFQELPSTSFDEPKPSRIIYHTPIIIPASNKLIAKPISESLNRISSINKLNDRIRRRLEARDQFSINQRLPITSIIQEEGNNSLLSVPTALSESSRRNAARIVDEHFNFIKEECDSDPIEQWAHERKAHDLKRADSLESSIIQITSDKYRFHQPHSFNIRNQFDNSQFQMPITQGRKKKASFLRRDSYFYQKCDVCLNEPRQGDVCPACGTIGITPIANVSQLTRIAIVTNTLSQAIIINFSAYTFRILPSRLYDFAN